MMIKTSNTRSVKQVVKGMKTTDGAGVKLTRIIGGMELNMLDPFLLLDEFGSTNPDDYIAGFPSHPHRGFETITYMLNGKWQHKDSAGYEGLLSDGSVQWMTAGRGIIHSEMPIQTNGIARGFQLWLNLPKKLKMIAPAYQDIQGKDIPVVNIPGGSVKVISGSFRGIMGPGKSRTAMLYFDINLDKNSKLEISVPDGWNAFAYIYEGNLSGNTNYSKGKLLVFSLLGSVLLESKLDAVKLILVAGEPINEPVARGGPFVMNTREEIMQAFNDYQNGVLDK